MTTMKWDSFGGHSPGEKKSYSSTNKYGDFKIWPEKRGYSLRWANTQRVPVNQRMTKLGGGRGLWSEIGGVHHTPAAAKKAAEEFLEAMRPVGPRDGIGGGGAKASPAAKRDGLKCYYSLLIPWEPNPAKQTEWHPTEPTGQWSTIRRGAFKTVAEAHAWARKHLGAGAHYTIRKH
jgi:hypothetical protein